MTFSLAGTRSARAALASPIRGRSSNTSVPPSRSPSTSTSPSVGKSWAAVTWSSVVLPAPFGPITTQRSSAWTVQPTSRSSSELPRRSPTPRSRTTSSDIRLLPRAAHPVDEPTASVPKTASGARLLPGRVPHRVHGGLGAVGHAELGQHGADVRLDGLFRHLEQPGDLPVGAPLGELREHLTLPGGQRVQARDRTGPVRRA